MFNPIMRPLVAGLGFASGVGAARIQIETAEAQFPNAVIIRNAEMQWSEHHAGDARQLLYAEDSADVMEGVGAAPPLSVVGQSNSWVIEQHQGSSAFTICNPHNCRCLFATGQRTVGASDLGFQDDQLWMIELTDPDDQLYTITHMTTGLRLYRGGIRRNEFGIGDDAFGRRERVWPDQTWYIEDRSEDDVNRCQLPPPVFPNPVILLNAHSDRLLYANARPAGAMHQGAMDPPFDWGNSVRPSNSFVIEQYQGSVHSTICNRYNGRCFYVSESGDAESAAVEATGPIGEVYRHPGDGSFSDSQLWRIEPTGDGKYTVTHRNTRLRLFARDDQEWSNGWGVGDGGRVWPDQTWYIEDRDEKCASDWRRTRPGYGQGSEVQCMDIEDCLSRLRVDQCG